MSGDPGTGTPGKAPSRVGDTGISSSSTLVVSCEEGEPIPTATRLIGGWGSSEPRSAKDFWAYLEERGFSVTRTPRSSLGSAPVKTPETERIGVDFATKILQLAEKRGQLRSEAGSGEYRLK